MLFFFYKILYSFSNFIRHQKFLIAWFAFCNHKYKFLFKFIYRFDSKSMNQFIFFNFYRKGWFCIHPIWFVFFYERINNEYCNNIWKKKIYSIIKEEENLLVRDNLHNQFEKDVTEKDLFNIVKTFSKYSLHTLIPWEKSIEKNMVVTYTTITKC